MIVSIISEFISISIRIFISIIFNITKILIYNIFGERKFDADK